MGGGGTDTSTSTSAPLNPEVNSTLSKLLQGVQATYQPGSGTPETLNTGWNSQLGAATNPDYARGVAGSTSELADIASG
jgi:phage tail sheath gpL-like